MALISVVLPTKDRLGWLPRAVQSVLDQTYQNWELVILDNAAEPGYPEDWRDPRVRYVHRDVRGVAHAYQLAVELAMGDIITQIGDDDRFTPQALERAAEAFDQWPSLQWLYGVTELRHQDESVWCHRGHLPFSLAELRKWYYLGGALYWRKSLSDRLGCYPEAYDGAADYSMCLEFAKDSVPLWIPEVLYLYTDWAGTDSRVRAANQLVKTEEIAARG